MNYAELRHILLHRDPKPALRPVKPWQPALTPVIDALDVAPLQRAALHLLNDDIARAHEIFGETETADANYGHAIVHRREGDFSNARYWLARVGAHRVAASMKQHFPEWDAIAFTEWCERNEKDEAWLQEVQLAELSLLV